MNNENITWSICDMKSLDNSSSYMVDIIAYKIRQIKDMEKSDIKIVNIETYRGTTMEEKAEAISDICNRYKDDNYVICTSTWVRLGEFEDERAIKRESKMLEALGFVDISGMVLCQTNISRAYIYLNAVGKKILDYYIKEQESE